MGYVSSPTLYGDLEEDQRNTGSQKSFRHKIVFESEYEDDALVKPETVSSPIVAKEKSKARRNGVVSCQKKIIKKRQCCVGETVKQKFGFIKRVNKG